MLDSKILVLLVLLVLLICDFHFHPDFDMVNCVMTRWYTLLYVICKYIPLSIIMVSAFHAYPHTPISIATALIININIYI